MDRSYRLMLVDDSRLVRNTYARLLELEDGLKVAWTPEDGREALRAIARADAPPDLIVLDWNLPGLSGEDLVQTVRQRCPQARLLVASGTSALTDAVRQAGADAYVQKGEPAELRAAVWRVLGRARTDGPDARASR
jgi:DNA-binding response OmpR family regulator